MIITGCCLPYGESKYHDAVQDGAQAATRTGLVVGGELYET